MGDYSFSISCECCSTVLFSVSGADRQAWKADAAAGGHKAHCANCGCAFVTVDDGVPVQEGGGVTRSNVSSPKVDSIDTLFGPRGGGNEIVLTGHSLDSGTLVVKFDGKLAPAVTSVTMTSANVTVPVGVYRLNVAEHLRTLVLSSVSGAFQVDEQFTTTAGSTGIIHHISGNTYMVVFQTTNDTLAEMVGTTLTGGTNGATGTISSAQLAYFTGGEQVTGLTSGATGSVRGGTMLTVDSPSDAFSPNELVQGATSGAMIKLSGSPAYSGLVDVTVENEYGRRQVGGALVGAYSFV